MGTAKDYVRVAYRKSSRTAEAERLHRLSGGVRRTWQSKTEATSPWLPSRACAEAQTRGPGQEKDHCQGRGRAAERPAPRKAAGATTENAKPHCG